jgi:hypothetical protein
MMRRGEPLGAVAAALASPETAERIAILEAATSGGMGALDAAWLNVSRAGGSLTLLDALRARHSGVHVPAPEQKQHSTTRPDPEARGDGEGAAGIAAHVAPAVAGQEVVTGNRPFPLATRNGSR